MSIVDSLDELYTSITDKSTLLTKTKFYSLERFVVRTIANVLLPLYFICTRNTQTSRLPKSCRNDKKIIVSLTTFPKRVKRLWLVIETLLRQSHKPDSIVLWLSSEQFESLEKLPKSLLKMQKRGLDIRLCDDDLKSHKKYYYAFNEFPNDNIITIDDDIFYPTTLIADLVALQNENNNSVCCHRALIMKAENGRMLPYAKWEEAKRYLPPNDNIFFTSGGGTLFPPHALFPDVLNKDIFKELCFFADDVWLNIMCRLNNTSIVKSNYYSSLLPVLNFQDVNLSSKNLIMGENDKQINNVRNYYFNKFKVDVLSKIFND